MTFTFMEPFPITRKKQSLNDKACYFFLHVVCNYLTVLQQSAIKIPTIEVLMFYSKE